MTILFENEQELALPFDPEQLAAAVAEQILQTEACPWESEISLTLTDPEGIRAMNAEFRDLDRETDVLSFPLIDFTAPSDFDAADADENFNPDSGELMLGDIVISVSRCREQAEVYGHSIRREYAFLVAHSVLHLLGYDHMTPEEAAVMEMKQEAALQALGITREIMDP